MIGGIILEGVTGAGKSQTMRALQAHPAFPALLAGGPIFPEEDTLGEFMDELRDPAIAPAQRYARLIRVLDNLERAAAGAHGRLGYLLERFHPSYYALVPEWQLYDAIDGRLRGLNATVVLLIAAPEQLERRALDRVDRQGWSEGMIAYFGSRQAANQAIAESQQRRRACARLSRLPTIEIDTTAMEWPRYAEQIVRVWSSSQAEPGDK